MTSTSGKPSLSKSINPAAPAGVTRFHCDFCQPRDVFEVALPIPSIAARRIARKMRLKDIKVPVKVVIPYPDTHPSLLHSVIAESDTAHDAFFAESAVVIVHEEQAGSGITSDEDVRPTIFIEVRRNHGHAIAFAGGGNARLLGHVRERAIPVVVVEDVLASRQSAGATVHRDALPVAGGVLAGHRSVLQIEADVVRDEQIEMAVSIIVQECAPGTPTRRTIFPKAGLLGHLGERAIAIVAVEAVLSEVGDEDIVETVVVIVGDANGVRPANGPQAGFIGHVGERAVTVVLIEPVGSFGRVSLEAGTG